MMMDWKPMWECIRIVPQRTASKIGYSVPAAKGAMVSGINAAEIALDMWSVEIHWSAVANGSLPLEDPMVAAMGGIWIWCRCWIIDYLL